MSEPIEGQPAATPTPEAPAQPAPVAQSAPQVDPAIAAFFEAKMSERISGLQSGYQKQINDLAAAKAELENQLKIASMSEEEREQQAEADAEAYLDSLESYRNIGILREQYPGQKGDLLAQIYQASSPDEIAAVLDSLLTPAPDASSQVPPVDPNNPPATSPAVATGSMLMADGQVYTKEMRQKILSDLSQGGRSFDDVVNGRA